MTALEVHQTVHGYSEGHRLLAASRRLPRDAERALLIMTDISGPVPAGGFHSYLTGAPIAGTTAYAVARTWLADEQNRPGCVWTHTLLVSQEDLERVPDLQALCTLHRRPRKGGPWQSYGEPLVLPAPPEPAAAPSPDWTERGAARTLAALYGVPDRPAFLEADQPERLEGLVLAVWNQAWPHLRGALRFCSWSLAPRSLGGEPLDLQVVPAAVGRHLRHTGAASTLVTPIPRFGQEPDDPTFPAWAQVAARDLRHEAGGPLRAFLREFGGDLGSSRAAFVPLVETHEEIEAVREGRAPLSELADAVGARFAAPLAARRLKGALFGAGAADDSRLLPEVSEAEVLRAVAITPHHAALDADMLAIRQRGGQLWASEPEQALAVVALLVEAATPSPIGAAFLSGVAAAVGLAEGRAIRKRSPEMFAALARRNPALAAALPAASVRRASEPPPDLPRDETPPPLVVTPAVPAAGSAPGPDSTAEHGSAGPVPEELVVGPGLAEPALTAPPIVEPVLAERIVVEPAEPVVVEPVMSGPVATEPIVPEPRVESAVAEPLIVELAPTAPVAPQPLAPEREPATVAEVLDRLDRVEALDEVADLAARWRGILASHPGEVVRWLARSRSPRAATAAVAASILDPRAPETRRIGADAWLRAVADAEAQLDAATHVRLMAFLLALALACHGPDGAVLAARAFAPVDRALATGELSPGAWQFLAAELPPLPWWREADHGERLRRGLIDRMVRDRWPAGALLEATGDDEAFQRLVVICEWTREGQTLLKQLAGQVSRGRLEATPGQRAALARYA